MSVSQEIKRAFAVGTTMLTATARTARWLRREYALEQRGAGRRAWATPPIEDWDTWLYEQWQAIALGDADAPLVLTSLQERRVWTRMMRADAEALVSPAGMAALAEGAYGLLSNYEAHAERNYAWGKTDADGFRRWAASFDGECARRGWMPGAELEGKIAAVLTGNGLPVEILLVGFERTTPAQARVLGALADKGVKVSFASAAVEDARMEYVGAPGLQQEIAACARWVRERLQKNPEARIGVLAPDLNAVRSDVERAFRRVLMPQTDDIFAEWPMPFEFSLGQPLGSVPGTRAALLLLRWLHAPLLEEEVSWLLLSGFLLQDDADFLKLAKLDAKRRDSEGLSLEISLQSFLKMAGTGDESALTRLEAVRKAADANRLNEEERLPGRWADVAQLLLREAGWPGALNRDTLLYQAMRRWERAMDEVALLDFDGQRMKYGEFLGVLEAHVQEVIFAPESEGAPVQIMGAVEASGQQFDAVWFLSVDDQSWPPRGRPHPLLPNDVQRRYEMPYADPENDLALARAVTERIATSAPTVVFSYAKRNKDGEMRPSPLLPRDEIWREVDEPPTEDAGPKLETLEEGSEVAAWPSDLIAGGSDVLKKQAACPFQAFAAKRLCAEPLNRNEWGLSAAERGLLLHETLEKIWSPTRGALHTLGDLQAAIRDGRLAGILEAAIAASFAKYDQAEGWERAYVESEKGRLKLRLEEWMQIEASRAPFDVMACEEALEQVSVGELRLRLRMDRMDALGDSGRVLIDYKTGNVNVNDWETPRLNEPQLPLYAVFGGVEDVRGVLFAQIRAGESGLIGSVANAEALRGADSKKIAKLTKEPYDATRRDAWEDALMQLASGFLRGEATVDPKNGKQTCEYCGLQGLCRVAEVQDPLDDGAGAEEEGDDE
jgi:ATP-dependent helicase/nuclease subunit B